MLLHIGGLIIYKVRVSINYLHLAAGIRLHPQDRIPDGMYKSNGNQVLLLLFLEVEPKNIQLCGALTPLNGCNSS